MIYKQTLLASMRRCSCNVSLSWKNIQPRLTELNESPRRECLGLEILRRLYARKIQERKWDELRNSLESIYDLT